MTFVQATFVLVTFVHIRIISAVIDTIWTKLERQGEGKVRKRSSKVLARSRNSQGKVKARLRQGQGNVKAMSR